MPHPFKGFQLSSAALCLAVFLDCELLPRASFQQGGLNSSKRSFGSLELTLVFLLELKLVELLPK